MDQNQANRAAAESGYNSEEPPKEGDGEVLETALGLFGQLVQVIQGAQPQTTAPTTAPSSTGVVSGPGPMRVTLAPAPYLSPRTISPQATAPSTYGWDRMTVGIGVALGLLLLGGALALRR
jgi:hypothetical protein